jgi:response regulator RpfG family c-di-GMP phosphodiesterase
LLSDTLKGILSSRSALSKSSRPNILIVIDDPAIRACVCDHLTQQGRYRCTGAASVPEAIHASRADTVDVAVLALAMPANASMMLARRLRHDIPDVPVVLMSGTRGFDAAVEAMRIGVFDYLLTPFEMSELDYVVDRAAEWRRESLSARSHPDDLLRHIAERTTHLSETLSAQAGGSVAELYSLLETLNHRHPETLAHARRVSRLSMAVTAAFGVEGPARSAIEQAALLHDLGKMAIPSAVIHKAGPLTAGEMALMRSHARIGHDVAAAVPCLRRAAEIILATHEHYDGSGYPRGLRAEAIPLGARIIAAADAFDALTSPCVYRDAVSIAHANAELVRGAGSQFDPDVIAAWWRCLDRRTGMPACLNAAETRH